MVRLIGIPRHAWRMVRDNVSASPGLVLWRVLLLAGLTYLTVVAWAATGGSGLAAVVLGFAVTSILSFALRDDILAVWRDLWNGRWAEVDV